MSLRARVLVGSVAIAVVLAVAALVVTRITEADLIARVDRQLEARGVLFDQPGEGREILDRRGVPPRQRRRSETDAGAAGDANGGPGQEDEVGPGTESGPSGTPAQVDDPLSVFLIGVVTDDGMRPILQPAGDEASPTPDIDPEEAAAAAADGEPFTTGSQGSDTRWRVRAMVADDTGELLIIAQSLADVDATVGRLVAVEVAATLAILAALGVVAWWVDHHGIRPVKRMTATASAIAAGDLAQRVPETGPGTEAGQLGTALNQMLARIEQAFDERSRSEDRLRQFVADASHELRTPVTTIRGYGELYESGGLDDPEELSEAMRRSRQEARRMGNLVDDMLLLARLDEGRLTLERTRVDLAALARDAGRDARAVDRRRAVATRVEAPLEVVGDVDQLRQVLANLVGNALMHTPSSAAIEIRAHRDGSHAVVAIDDRGPGMPPGAVERAFDRFYRADPSRSRHRGGSGLGLAIVQASVAAHGGHVCLESTLGQGTTARVTLPLAPDDRSDDAVRRLVRGRRRFPATSRVALVWF
jgi:two-component system, OmpR family, sensor kinase